MKQIRRNLAVLVFVIGLIALGSNQGRSETESTQLTVYNQGLALVREVRKMVIQSGQSQARIEDVPALIDPTSVFFKSLTDPAGVRILEQNYDYDLVSQGKLWDKYLGKNVEVEMSDPETHKAIRKTAKLLSTGWTFGAGGWSQTGSPIIEMEGKVYIQPPGQIIFPALSQGEFLLRPTLNWMLDSRGSGAQNIELSYLTKGLSWDANYVIVTDSHDMHLDLTGWVSLQNTSGTAFHEAKLQLMAGDVHTIQPMAAISALRLSYKDAVTNEQAQFQEKPFFEYHLYTLGRPATLLNDQTKQIELLSAHDVPMQKVFVYDGAPMSDGYYYDDYNYRETPRYGPQSNKKVWVMLEFMNSKENHLGQPLPRGTVRVYKTDEDGSRQFVGEDTIDHTPKDETIRLFVGNAFDVVGERKQMSFVEVVPHHVYDETYQVDLRNHKSEAVTVKVVEHLWRWNDWRITESSHKWSKMDSHTIEFPVQLPANGSQTVTYTVRYHW